jgi:hypothetical protein
MTELVCNREYTWACENFGDHNRSEIIEFLCQSSQSKLNKIFLSLRNSEIYLEQNAIQYHANASTLITPTIHKRDVQVVASKSLTLSENANTWICIRGIHILVRKWTCQSNSTTESRSWLENYFCFDHHPCRRTTEYWCSLFGTHRCSRQEYVNVSVKLDISYHISILTSVQNSCSTYYSR